VAAATAAAALAVVPALPASAGPGEADFVSIINAERSAAGLPPLAVATDLTLVAQAHSAQMAATGTLYHTPDLATQVTNWTALGENVGEGPSVQSIADAFYASAPHRANILNTSYTQVGVGTVLGPNGVLWVTEEFRKPAVGFQVGGAIGAVYPAFSALIGAPTSGEYDVRGGRGQSFERGKMLWSWGTGAREVNGAIQGRYDLLGGAASVLALPTTSETATPDGYGRYNHFQSGSVYWSPASGAFSVIGAIRDEWARLGWERGLLRYPVTDELGTPDGVGRFGVFQGGSAYWSPRTGAHEVHGMIRDTWARLGWERSRLGYPVSDEYAVPGGRRSDFQGGSIVWNAVTRTTTVG
jgi:hypothetical protein